MYRVGLDEGCFVIVVMYGFEEEDFDEMNRYIWGWDGCDVLFLDQVVCVSIGDLLMFVIYLDVVCGFIVFGLFCLLDICKMVEFNLCLFNVCCNVWGNCGMIVDFCIIFKMNMGNFGISCLGENGCQFSCGIKIVNDFEGLVEFWKIVYYEGWNYKRFCLNMNVLDIDRLYIYVYFVFVEILVDMQVVIFQDSQKQWQNFVVVQNFFWKIFVFGGWVFFNEGEGVGCLCEVVSFVN